jgi:hypothetical protein
LPSTAAISHVLSRHVEPADEDLVDTTAIVDRRAQGSRAPYPAGDVDAARDEIVESLVVEELNGSVAPDREQARIRHVAKHRQ